MSSLQDALAKAGLALQDETKNNNQQPAATAPADVDFSAHEEWALHWAAAGIQLFGSSRLLKELKAGTDGTGRSADALCVRVERALDVLPAARSKALRAEMDDLWARKGVPTFCSRADQVRDAVNSGAVDAWIAHERDEATVAEATAIPKPEEGEDLEAYRGRLEMWSADKPAGVLKRLGFDVCKHVEAERQRREAEANAEAQRKAVAERDELGAILGDNSFEAVCSGLKAWTAMKKAAGVYLGGYEKQVLNSRWGWALYASTGEEIFGFYTPPEVPPTPEAVALLEDLTIFKYASADGNFSRADVLRGEVVRRFPLQPGQVALVDGGRDRENYPIRYAISPDGEAQRARSSTTFPPASGTYPTTPDPKGWWNRLSGFDVGVWCGPAVYQALQRLERANRGAVLITPEVMGKFGRHAERGYPRFYFEVGAGRRRSSFDLPVWRPGQGEGWLAERLDDIKLLVEHKLPVPENAYWMDVQIGVTTAGNPRLEPVRHGQVATPAICLFTSEGAMSQGKWGWSGKTHSAVSGSEKGGSKILWSTFVSSAGGGVHRTADLLWITRDGSVALTSGQAVTFDGEKIVKVAGGGLDQADDPTRG